MAALRGRNTSSRSVLPPLAKKMTRAMLGAAPALPGGLAPLLCSFRMRRFHSEGGTCGGACPELALPRRQCRGCPRRRAAPSTVPSLPAQPFRVQGCASGQGWGQHKNPAGFAGR